MDDVKERDINKYLAATVKRVGRELRKVNWDGIRGAPDFRILGFAWVESKKPGEKLQPHQEREIGRMRDAGERVEVVDSFERIDELAEEM